MEKKNISKAVIRRLPRYYRYLEELKEEGVSRISSQDLAKRMNVTASQIRQDLNYFGGFGQQGFGYKITELYDEIGKILGIGTQKHLILIGAGNLGRALSNYANYRHRGFCIQAIFDSDEKKIGKKVQNLTVLAMDELENYIDKNDVDIAVIAIPKGPAVKVADRLVKAGITAIWNFSHTELPVPANIIVENVHLSESLMQLSYRIQCEKDKKTKK